MWVLQMKDYMVMTTAVTAISHLGLMHCASNGWLLTFMWLVTDWWKMFIVVGNAFTVKVLVYGFNGFFYHCLPCNVQLCKNQKPHILKHGTLDCTANTDPAYVCQW